MATTPTFNRPDNIHSAMQYNGTTGEPELRVNLGSDSITITGSVNVGTVVEVESTPDNPVHTHISEVGTSGILTVPYLPVGILDVTGNPNGIAHPLFVDLVNGIISVEQNGPWTTSITGSVNVGNFPVLQAVTITNTPTVNIGTIPEVEIKNDVGNPIPVSGTLTVNQGTSPWIVKDLATDIIVADSNYEMNLARGLLTGQAIVTRNGYNANASKDIETSIWVEGGIYPFANWTVASQIYIASDNAADTGLTIVIAGLDANYDLQTETIIVNGLTTAVTINTWMRIYSATIISSSTIDANVGTVLFRISSASGIVVAHIAPGLGLTKLSQYTIPRNKTGYILFGDATSFRAGSGNIGTQIRMYVRQYNGPFIAAHIAEVVNGHYRTDFTVPLMIPARGDIDVRCFADANNTQITCNYQLIIVDN